MQDPMKSQRLFLILLFFLFAFPFTLFGQNEIERERISLEGIQEIGFTANLEGSRSVTSDSVLTPTALRQQSVNQLVDAGLQYISDMEVESSADIPFLYMHINMMEMENGLIPFSISLRLYQPVKLKLNRDLQTSASTWETGMVGLVSFDRVPTIMVAAEGLIQEFVDDFLNSNPNYSGIR